MKTRLSKVSLWPTKLLSSLTFPSAPPLHILQEGRREFDDVRARYNKAVEELDQAIAKQLEKATALGRACDRLDDQVEVRKSALLFDVAR